MKSEYQEAVELLDCLHGEMLMYADYLLLRNYIDSMYAKIAKLEKHTKVLKVLNDSLIMDYISIIKEFESWNEVENETYKGLERKLNNATMARRLEEWHEDIGDCLWWSFPIEEPPYCGTPLDCDFPNYVTHFTKLIIPKMEGVE